MHDHEQETSPSTRTLRGRTVVLGMLVFGVVMVGAMWLYWEMYTRPFRPLQNAIEAEFPGSSPRVVGGRHKSHKDGSPSLLRIVVWVDFDPETADDATVDRQVTRLRTLAAEQLDLTPYDTLEIHLIQRVPEEEARKRTFEFPLRTMRADPRPTTEENDP